MEYHLQLPITVEQISPIQVGDLVYLTGLICTGRDQVHSRIISLIKAKKSLPAEFDTIKGGALYHMGPIIRTIAPNQYQIVAGGPTTSARMNPYAAMVGKILDLRCIIGKGGMQVPTWSELKALYLAFPGGAAAIATKFFQKIKTVVWLDLGMPEAAWFIEVKEFGPLVVGIDIRGNALYPR
jgi:fumarate hydratase subunit beta